MIMKNVMTILVIALLALAGMPSALAQDESPPVERLDVVTPDRDFLLNRVEKSDRVFKRLENTRIKMTSFFHQRMVGPAIVEKDFIRYIFDSETNELIEETKRWRKGLPKTVTPKISQAEAESLVKGAVTSSQLLIISPESEIFHLKPSPQNPCWIVRCVDEDRQVTAVIDAMTGKLLGYGIPPPYEGLAIHGPDHDNPPDTYCDNNNPLWNNHAQNAHDWFETMGYDTQKIGSATATEIKSHIQSDSTVMFYELDHGGSTSFKNRCEDNTYASEIESWISGYASMGFAFIGSCEGLCSTGDNTFSYEFRKGSSVDSVTLGYCHMSDDFLCENDCWGHAIAWQTVLFDYMNQGHTVSYAYYRANLAYPDCTDDNHDCMRIEGDTNLKFAGSGVPKMRRSRCGAIYNILPYNFSPLGPVNSRHYTRGHHIRCNSYVPSGYWLTIGASSSYPYNDIVFDNDSKLTCFGSYIAVDADSSGGIYFVSGKTQTTGMKVINSGSFNIYNSGEIKVYE